MPELKATPAPAPLEPGVITVEDFEYLRNLCRLYGAPAGGPPLMIVSYRDYLALKGKVNS